MKERLIRIIKNPKRLFLTFGRYGLLNWLPDDMYVKTAYHIIMGKKLDLINPQSFNEKLQWLKINDHNPLYTIMVDKNAAKDYVSKLVGTDYIIPTLGVWDSYDDIDFEMLPKRFVLKCTHDSGGLVVCKDKNDLDHKMAKKKITKSLKRNYYYQGREWPYKDVKPKIIAEKYVQDDMSTIDDDNKYGLTDYKFYCFNGVPKYLYISRGLDNHSTAQISFLNMDWSFAPFGRSDYKPFNQLPEKPKSFEEMKTLAEILSNGIPFLRVDLYEIDGHPYFSELTFTPCGGMMPFTPEKYDYVLGDQLIINMDNR